MRRRKHSSPTEECPHCGGVVRRNAAFCLHCGSDAATGWADAEDIAYQSVEIPDFLGNEEEPARSRISWKAVLFGIGLTLVFLALMRFLFPLT